MSSTLDESDCIISKLHPSSIPYYSDKDIAYQIQDERYKSFYLYPPEKESFLKAIRDREKYQTNRTLVIKAFQHSYESLAMSESQKKNLNDLALSSTYTVTTAHQPSLFTGPLYFIYKICTTIKLARNLNNTYTDFQFIPVFVSGGEDHDFDEINHCYIHNNKIVWDQKKGGAVGRLPVEDLNGAIESLKSILGNEPNSTDLIEMITESYENSTQYKTFQFQLINKLFASYGLLVLDMDQKILKQSFIPSMEKEITGMVSKSVILETQSKLEEVGFKSQAFPRDINLFYLQDGRRDRIEIKNDKYIVLDTDISFTQKEIVEELNKNPEKFSPNVVMRPMYQEAILPNLAYIGGGGEIAYWLERKKQFELFGIPFPILIRRNSAMIVTPASNKMLEKLNLTPEDLFQDVDIIINDFLQKNTEVDIYLESEKGEIDKIFEKISVKAGKVDPTLTKWIQAEKIKQIKLLEQIESRIKRTVKHQEEIKVNQIRKIKEKLFPQNGLQERYDNFFQYYATDGPSLLDLFIHTFDPFDQQFYIIQLGK